MHRFALTRNHLIYALLLCVVWGVSFLMIVTVSPVQPRMTITLGDATVVGITPDSRELVALTKRRKANDGYDFPSGPVQIWNLQTGEKRLICLLDQSCTEPLDHSLEPPLMLEPEGRDAKPMPVPFRGRWFQLRFESDEDAQFNRVPAANLLLNLDTGEYQAATDGENLVSGLELSLNGRWFIELRTSITLWKDSPLNRLRILETATGKEQLAFDVPHHYSEWAFSPDERLFAHLTPPNDERPGEQNGRLKVWQIQPPKLLYQVENVDSGPVFSEDSQLLAFLREEQNRLKIVILDAGSGLPVMEHLAGKKHHYANRLRFSADSNWLFYSRASLLRSFVETHAYHPQLDLSFAIDLRTNTRVDLSEAETDSRQFIAGYEPESMPPFALQGYNELIELPTGRHLGLLPDFTDSLAVTRDGQTLLLEHAEPREPSPLRRMVEFFASYNVPLPQSVWNWTSGTNTQWVFMDVSSRCLHTWMPAQERLHWLSPDDQTLVTRPLDGSPVVHIWDFPPRKPWRSAALWALMAPVLISFLWRWRSRDRRGSAGAVVA